MQTENCLLSVGIDIGTTTTHLVVTSLKFGNLARPTQINEIGLTDKKVLFQSPIYQTPLNEDGSIDAGAVAALISQAYTQAAREANLDMQSVQTGAVIITGESARARNAQALLKEIADLAGEFVVESAGPGLESILCARGSGAQALSKEQGLTVLNVDIGGGTSNFALVQNGLVTETAAMAIGGKAIKFAHGKLSHLSSTASYFCHLLELDLRPGLTLSESDQKLKTLARKMANEIAHLCSAGQKTSDRKREQAIDPDRSIWLTDPLKLKTSPDMLLFSGGVAQLMQDLPQSADRYQDFGVYLASALIEILQDKNIDFSLAPDAIRATVLGAGMHTLQLSGSTVGLQGENLPLRNAPIIKIDISATKDLFIDIQKALVQKDLDWSATAVVLALSGLHSRQLQYGRIKALAGDLAAAHEQSNACEPLIVVIDQDIAMALGLLLKRLMPDKRIISVDGIAVRDGDYLDIGKPLHSNTFSDNCTQTLPVVVKTLIFYKN